jgi:putative lipoic acid-binding regulatory protein
MFPSSETKLKFPCRWHGRVIAVDHPGTKERLDQSLKDHGYHQEEVLPGNLSSNGNYRSFAVSVELRGEGDLDRLVKGLGAVAGVKTVL